MKTWLLPVTVAILMWITGPPPRVVHAQPNVGQFGPTNQQAVTGTAALVNLTSATVVCIKALPANTSPSVVYLGSTSSVTTSTGYPLSASESTCVPAQQPIYVVASGAGSGIAWFTTTQ